MQPGVNSPHATAAAPCGANAPNRAVPPVSDGPAKGITIPLASTAFSIMSPLMMRGVAQTPLK
jgi:hypothetical protein